MYGWRGRIGLVVPSTNTVNEPDFYRHLPEGVSVHTARMLLKEEEYQDDGGVSELSTMTERGMERCGSLLSTTDIDVAFYGCTSGSFVEGPSHDEVIESTLESYVGAPAVATSASLRRALRHVNTDSVAITTPYIDEVVERARNFFEAAGFDVQDVTGLDIDVVGSNRSTESHGSLTPETAYRMARALDHQDADAVLIACTNYHATDVIEQLEADLGKPIVTSNQAMLWDALRTIGVDYREINLGTLFDH